MGEMRWRWRGGGGGARLYIHGGGGRRGGFVVLLGEGEHDSLAVCWWGQRARGIGDFFSFPFFLFCFFYRFTATAPVCKYVVDTKVAWAARSVDGGVAAKGAKHREL